MTTEEAERAQKANIALATFSNYIQGWIESFQGYYGIGDTGISLFKHKIQESSNYQQIRSFSPIPEELVNTYSRGKLTVNAISELPIATNDGLALTGNLWLPVQAYYAINGVGWATMIALRMSMPRSKTHGIFRKYFSHLMNVYMPKPFCSTCEGGPGLRDYAFRDMALDLEVVIALKPFKPFEEAVGAEYYVGKSLSTTRTEFLKDRLKVQRETNTPKKLSKDAILRCCRKEHNTSICDLFYKLRKRSNYENPDMYLYAEDNELARERYRSFQHLTELLIVGLEELLEKAIGQQEMQTLKAKLKPVINDYVTAPPVLPVGHQIFRAVNARSKHFKIEDITHPPPSRVTSAQRVNRKGQPVFYGSLQLNSLFLKPILRLVHTL